MNLFGSATTPILGATEIGENAVIIPAAIAQLRPVIIVGAMAACVDHAIDSGAAADALGAGHEHDAVVHVLLGNGVVAPVQLKRLHQAKIAHRHVDPGAGVPAACLDHRNFHIGILAQAVDENGAA